jgi:hypothetical protein
LFILNKSGIVLVVFATPAITNLYVLSILFFFQGISQGLTDLGLSFFYV